MSDGRSRTGNASGDDDDISILEGSSGTIVLWQVALGFLFYMSDLM
jgi:hypothetical protein